MTSLSMMPLLMLNLMQGYMTTFINTANMNFRTDFCNIWLLWEYFGHDRNVNVVLVGLKQLCLWQWIDWSSYLGLKFSKLFQVVYQQKWMQGLYAKLSYNFIIGFTFVFFCVSFWLRVARWCRIGQLVVIVVVSFCNLFIMVCCSQI